MTAFDRAGQDEVNDCPMTPTCPRTIGSTLRTVFRPYPNLALEFVDQNVYRSFRIIEPDLVSCLDSQGGGAATINVLGVRAQEEQLGVLSLVVQHNVCRPPGHDAYARIDLVIVKPSHRGLGVGRILTLAALLYALESWEDRLYSISCLAADPAMERILEAAKFVRNERQGKQFVHEELKIGYGEASELRDKILQDLSPAVKLANYRTHQRRMAVSGCERIG